MVVSWTATIISLKRICIRMPASLPLREGRSSWRRTLGSICACAQGPSGRGVRSSFVFLRWSGQLARKQAMRAGRVQSVRASVSGRREKTPPPVAAIHRARGSRALGCSLGSLLWRPLGAHFSSAPRSRPDGGVTVFCGRRESICVPAARSPCCVQCAALVVAARGK